MLSRRSAPVDLLWSALDFRWTISANGVGTIYGGGSQQFHLLLHEDAVNGPGNRLLWLEVLPERLTLTMQGDGNSHFRHLLKPGATGTSHFWVGEHRLDFTNFTRRLWIDYQTNPDKTPRAVQVEYELWISHQRLGTYRLEAKIDCD